MRFKLVEEHSGSFPTDLLCRVMSVSRRGLLAYRSRAASRRQRMDMIVLAHIATSGPANAGYIWP